MIKSKQQVARDYMERRQVEHRPPPSAQEIKRQMGWDLVEAHRAEQERLAMRCRDE